MNQDKYGIHVTTQGDGAAARCTVSKQLLGVGQVVFYSRDKNGKKWFRRLNFVTARQIANMKKEGVVDVTMLEGWDLLTTAQQREVMNSLTVMGLGGDEDEQPPLEGEATDPDDDDDDDDAPFTSPPAKRAKNNAEAGSSGVYNPTTGTRV